MTSILLSWMKIDIFFSTFSSRDSLNSLGNRGSRKLYRFQVLDYYIFCLSFTRNSSVCCWPPRRERWRRPACPAGAGTNLGPSRIRGSGKLALFRPSFPFTPATGLYTCLVFCWLDWYTYLIMTGLMVFNYCTCFIIMGGSSNFPLGTAGAYLGLTF